MIPTKGIFCMSYSPGIAMAFMLWTLSDSTATLRIRATTGMIIKGFLSFSIKKKSKEKQSWRDGSVGKSTGL